MATVMVHNNNVDEEGTALGALMTRLDIIDPDKQTIQFEPDAIVHAEYDNLTDQFVASVYFESGMYMVLTKADIEVLRATLFQ